MSATTVPRQLGRVLTASFVMLALALLVFASVWPGRAAALPTACHRMLRTYAGFNAAEYYRYTIQYTVPSSSPCHDVNISHILRQLSLVGAPNEYCGFFRVRFYPSSGGSYTNSWQWICTLDLDNDWEVIATNILNGTKYRVETFGPDDLSFAIWD